MGWLLQAELVHLSSWAVRSRLSLFMVSKEPKLHRSQCTSHCGGFFCLFIWVNFFRVRGRRAFVPMQNTVQCCIFTGWLISLALVQLFFTCLCNIFSFFFHISLYQVVIDWVVSWPWLGDTNPFYLSPFSAGQERQRMENNSKSAELTEFPVLTFAFYTAMTEWQEQGAVDWHISERGGNMLYSLTVTQLGEKPNFSFWITFVTEKTRSWNISFEVSIGLTL